MASTNLNSNASFFAVLTKLLLTALLLSTTIKPSTLQPLLCQNNGTIKNSICECLPPWTGEFCTEYLCVHGLSVGSQFDENNIFFNKRCICDAGYNGDLCDIPLINPCGSHGSLIDDKCVCNANYSGAKCESVDFCLHGQLSTGRCNCNYGWSSDFCNVIICHQGIADGTNSNCTCRSGYRGTFCDFCVESESELTPYPECAVIRTSKFYESKRFIIATGAILTIILISSLVLFFVLRKRNQRVQRKRNGPKETNAKKRMRRIESDDENNVM